MVDTGSVAADIGCDHAGLHRADRARHLFPMLGLRCGAGAGPVRWQAIEEAAAGKIIPVLQDGDRRPQQMTWIP
ncbi:MAG: hypothetical protein ACLTCB_05645 [Merdibacter sp.]